ncbi:MAG: mechanosensitive ion channel family protein [Deltaproteobacteria bacterium]|nr:mechanosensitive ion channel family protein [Deltaproteobacteria bacterium]
MPPQLAQLDLVFFQNDLWRWFAFFVAVLFSAMVGRGVLFLLRKVVEAFTRKTATRLDDLVLDAVQRPLSVMLSATGVYAATFLLSFQVDGAAKVLGRFDLIFGLYGFAVAIALTFAAVRLYGDLLEHYVRPMVEATDTKLDDQLLPIAVRGGRMVLWALGLMVAASSLGIDVTSLIAGLGIGGLAFALAAQDTVANVFGGASIFADKPFQMGDLITVKGATGVVEEIGVRTTRLRTLEDTIFVIPNSDVADSALENLSARRRRKKMLTIGLIYDTTPAQLRQAKEILREIFSEQPLIDEDVALRFDDFAASSLNLVAIYWVRDVSAFFAVVDEVNLAIHERFVAAGLEMAFPTQTLYLKREG